MEGEDPMILELIDSAHSARERAYCPYSNFRVGAAVLCEDGTVFSGTNVENACYGLTICAERSAIFTAVGQGYTKFTSIAVCCDIKSDFKASCGACRQVIAEFGLDCSLYMIKPDKTYKRIDFGPLLPDAFTPAFLQKERATSARPTETST